MHSMLGPGSRWRTLSLLANARPRQTVYLCFAVVFAITLVLAGRQLWLGSERQLKDRQHHLHLLANTIGAAIGAREEQLRFLQLSAEHVLATAEGEQGGVDDHVLLDALQAGHEAVWQLPIPGTDAVVRSISNQRLSAIAGYQRDPVALVQDLKLARAMGPLLSAQYKTRKGLAHVMLVTRTGLIVTFPAIGGTSIEQLLRGLAGAQFLSTGTGSQLRMTSEHAEHLKPGADVHLLYSLPILLHGTVRGVFILSGPQQRLQNYLYQKARPGEPYALLDSQGTILASNEKTFTPLQGSWFNTLPTQIPGLSVDALFQSKVGILHDAGDYYLYRELPEAQLMLIHHVTAKALRWGVISQFSAIFIGIWISLALLLLVVTLSIVDHLLKRQLSLNEQLRELGLVDMLTQLANRRRLQMDFKGLVRRFQGQQPIALLMIDIDKFKHINDNWGHSAGDEVLKHLATLCRAQVRPQDLVARYGGEEFCILLPATGLAHAADIAGQLRESIAQSVCLPQASTLLGSAPSAEIRLTVSIGVAEVNADRAANLEELVAKADRRLYTAKQNGRNRVIADDALTDAQVQERT